MVKEPLGFVKVLQWVSVLPVVGLWGTRRESSNGVQKSRDVGLESYRAGRSGMTGMEGDEGIGL